MAKRKTFYVSAAIFDAAHSAYAVAVYAYLSYCADKQGVCFPSIETIASHTGMSRSSVKRTLISLEQEGLIRSEATRQQSKSGRTRRGTNRYHLLNMPSGTVLSEPTPRISENLPSGSERTHPRVSENREINNNSKLTMGDVPSVDISRCDATDGNDLGSILEKLHLDLFEDRLFAESVEQTIRRMYAAPHVSVGGQRAERDAVRARLNMLTIDHIDYVERQIGERSGEVACGERYLMSCIYNAPVDCMVKNARDRNVL